MDRPRAKFFLRSTISCNDFWPESLFLENFFFFSNFLDSIFLLNLNERRKTKQKKIKKIFEFRRLIFIVFSRRIEKIRANDDQRAKRKKSSIKKPFVLLSDRKSPENVFLLSRIESTSNFGPSFNCFLVFTQQI